jgi:cobyrinic acid a,c-diamide synthase
MHHIAQAVAQRSDDSDVIEQGYLIGLFDTLPQEPHAMTTATKAPRTSTPRLSQVAAMMASMAAILVGFLALAPAPSATAGVIINNDALTVKLSPWGTTR